MGWDLICVRNVAPCYLQRVDIRKQSRAEAQGRGDFEFLAQPEDGIANGGGLAMGTGGVFLCGSETLHGRI